MEKRRRRLSRLSLKKHFRKSMMYDYLGRTIPKGSISIIEISSSDSEYSEVDSNDDAPQTIKNENSVISLNSDSEDIIPNSPNENKKFQSPSLSKIKNPKKKLYNTETDMGDTKLNKKKCSTLKNIVENAYLGTTILGYDDFKTPPSKQKHLVNSTMLEYERDNLEKENSMDNSISNNSFDSETKSCENVLDAVYGDSWRALKDKILPKSEKKPSVKKPSVVKPAPATEGKFKRSEIYKNPYVETEKKNSKNILKALHIKRLEKYTNSPFVKIIDNLCDGDSSEHEFVPSAKINRQRLHFSEDDLSDEKENENEPEKSDPNSNDNIVDFHCCDKEIPEKALSLEERIRNKNALNNVLEKKPKESPNENINYHLETKELDADKKNIDNKNSSSSDDSFLNSLPLNVKNTRKKKLKKYFYSSDSNSEPEEKHELPLTNNNKKQVSGSDKNFKSNATKNSSSDSKNVKKVAKNSGETVEKRVLKTKTKKQTHGLESSSSLEDNLVKSFDKINLQEKGNQRVYSFLASLSSNVPDDQCDPRAKVYKATFKNCKIQLTKELFALYNKKIFDNCIPENLPLEWNSRMVSTAGFCYLKRITHTNGKIDREARIALSTKVLTLPERVRDTLVHEMCHAAAWLINEVRDGHGKYFKSWAAKATSVFPELPPIKTCHNYEINSKYVYKCVKCGYSINRHRKSLDIERKRCGHCLGKFEIFINKVNKKGEKNLVPADTPKKPATGFALFMQENRSKYQHLNGAQMMRLLGQDYKQMKNK